MTVMCEKGHLVLILRIRKTGSAALEGTHILNSEGQVEFLVLSTRVHEKEEWEFMMLEFI